MVMDGKIIDNRIRACYNTTTSDKNTGVVFKTERGKNTNKGDKHDGESISKELEKELKNEIKFKKLSKSMGVNYDWFDEFGHYEGAELLARHRITSYFG